MERVSRRLSWVCVGCGLIVLVLLGTAAVRDTRREWKTHQLEYRALKLKRMTRDANPSLYDRVVAMKPELRQIVIDEWGTIDRCTTCHMAVEDPAFASAQQPLRTHPRPELLKVHPVETFGCTICHGGQGLATTYYGSSHDPIADWPVTLVRRGLMQSRCGYCHKDFEAIHADRLVAGRALYRELHCAGCHQIDGQGGTVGPDLSGFADKDPSSFSMEYLRGSRTKQDWVIEHFQDPKRVSPGSLMRAYALSDEQIESLSSYVLSLTQRDLSRKFTPRTNRGFVAPRGDLAVREAALNVSEPSDVFDVPLNGE
jgi:mono/diheme cytochrome c family protein